MLRPRASEWVDALVATKVEDRQRAMRAELGLPTSGRVVMSGHQSELWHPGILTKWFAAEAVARAAHGRDACATHLAWIEVDQDANEPWRVAYPAAGPTRATWTMRHGGATPAPDTPTGAIAPVRVSPGDVDALDPAPGYDFARDGLRNVAVALEKHAGAVSLAEQYALARNDLLAWAGTTPSLVYATRLSRTTLFAEVMDAMRRDPRACVEALNSAAKAHPAARVRALEVTRDRVELPLWRVEAGKPRRRVYVDELASTPPESLAPRALLMTALLRAGACDLFIHGLGGERYDVITEAWMQQWLGWRLAPTAVATASMHLPFGASGVPTPEAVAAAQWRAWHARHDPAMLGDRAAAERKRALVAASEASTSRSQRAALHREVRALTEASRVNGAAALAALAAEAAALRAQGASSGVVFDRTWAFPLFPRRSLAGLRDAVHARFAATV